jgi:protein associated with RNAse G/E
MKRGLIMKIIEEKTHYNGPIDRVECLLLKKSKQEIVLLYRISKNYNARHFNLPIGTFTIAYYYFDRPYNLYHWISPSGDSIGYYFNIVKDVYLKENTLYYTDLIVDILVKNDLSHYILDLDELPCPLEKFEDGKVKKYVDDFLLDKKEKIDYFKKQSKIFIEQDLQKLWDKHM